PAPVKIERRRTVCARGLREQREAAGEVEVGLRQEGYAGLTHELDGEPAMQGARTLHARKDERRGAPPPQGRVALAGRAEPAIDEAREEMGPGRVALRVVIIHLDRRQDVFSDVEIEPQRAGRDPGGSGRSRSSSESSEAAPGQAMSRR